MNIDRISRTLATLLLACGLFTGPVFAGPLRFEAAQPMTGRGLLEIQGDELVTMTALPFRLHLSGADGKPLTGARVSCELTMPSMHMPENHPAVVERDGIYLGEMILTCTMGDWRATCVAEEENGTSHTMIFDIGTARMK